MRPPEFWDANVSDRDAAHVLRAVLTPLSWAYAWAGAQRFKSTAARRAPVPVVCVGNLTLGGAGKTPVARAVRAELGAHAHLLSRGYGGRLPGPLRVTPDMDPREVGDEPLLHAGDGPAWIARDRLAGALAAASAGARAIIMDDGFQNPALAKDLSLLVFDAGFGIGNGAVFPAGPLRERVADGFRRADAAVMLHNTMDRPRRLTAALAGEGPAGPCPTWLARFGKPILYASLQPTAPAPDGKLIAFAGLARPEKFFDTLEAAGGVIEEALPYPDHHFYSAEDLDLLGRLSHERGARLITTEKDAARLSPVWRARVLTLPVEAVFDEPAALRALLAPIASRMS